ncbi:carboxypeptidase-like regulatory domain-containing protein [Chryseobacterium sp.]|uniref:carboxypeptidase-like regulatory domain-containing protein n=1 Tax=Chryseobacterium sp. TaxID=1871047 RepID=UPI00289C08E5|nr:carboxypeptidase-like regulatory domain-containing protein [Chryseobacterium sp.]
MKCKLLFFFSLLLSLNFYAQEYIFGKVSSEENAEIPNVTVINIRTDERVVTNRDGHFMISGRLGDDLRFISLGYERFQTKVNVEALKSPLNITLKHATLAIEEVVLKRKLTGDLKIDTKVYNPSTKVQKLRADMGTYLRQKSDPKILAAKPGEFVQPVTKGTFSFGKIKDKWDDVDFMNYIIQSLGADYFKELKIEASQIQHFIYYIFNSGFERKRILKYGYCSDADLNRFKGAVLQRISSYKSPQLITK